MLVGMGWCGRVVKGSEGEKGLWGGLCMGMEGCGRVVKGCEGEKGLCEGLCVGMGGCGRVVEGSDRRNVKKGKGLCKG